MQAQQRLQPAGAGRMKSSTHRKWVGHEVGGWRRAASPQSYAALRRPGLAVLQMCCSVSGTTKRARAANHPLAQVLHKLNKDERKPILEIACAGMVKGGFHPQAVIWVIRLTSPHLPLRVRQPQGRSDGRNERCCSQLRVCSYRAGFSHPPHTPSKPLQPREAPDWPGAGEWS